MQIATIIDQSTALEKCKTRQHYWHPRVYRAHKFDILAKLYKVSHAVFITEICTKLCVQPPIIQECNYHQSKNAIENKQQFRQVAAIIFGI